jgi:hypothetical protein
MKGHLMGKAIKSTLALVCCVFCQPAKADPINADITFVWQKPNESFQRHLNVNLIKNQNAYFFPLVNWGDLRSRMHQALVVDAGGNRKCAEQKAPWGPYSQGEWCARITPQTAGTVLIEYREKFDNYQTNRSQPLGRSYEVDLRFNVRWSDEKCSVELGDGQETYGGTQAHKVITITNVLQQLCSVHASH